MIPFFSAFKLLNECSWGASEADDHHLIYTLRRFWFALFAILCAGAFCSANAASIVSGIVFCDQCRDGHLSLYDYPLSGIRVAVTCPGSNVQGVIIGEETTNWFGSYSFKFDGTPDLSSCVAQVTGSNGDTHNCAASAGPPQRLRAVFQLFGYAVYSADSLLSQPPQPMSFCPKSAPPPIHTLPPFPYSQASACPHQTWAMPHYRCYWRTINPETKVALLFGPLAEQKYGRNMTMWQSLQGRGEPYLTLLREGTTAYLNSFNCIQFPYNTFAVVAHMNAALAGSKNKVLVTGLRFIRANGGFAGKTSCRFTPSNGKSTKSIPIRRYDNKSTILL